jgi:hypothetical protein
LIIVGLEYGSTNYLKCDSGEDITEYMDFPKAKRLGLAVQQHSLGYSD